MHFFIQARTGSTRLPRKVLLPFYENQSILEIIINRLKSKFRSIPIVVCTSTADNDNIIEQFCKINGVDCFRGDETNVLNRFIAAASFYKATSITRICADNPFLDMNFLENLLNFQKEIEDADYWSYKSGTGFPVIRTHFGFFAEIVTLKALKRVQLMTDDELYFEHVTNFIYENSEFKTQLQLVPNFLIARSDLRFTIDDKNDFIVAKKIYEHYIKINCNLEKTISYVDDNPHLIAQMKANINRYSK